MWWSSANSTFNRNVQIELILGGTHFGQKVPNSVHKSLKTDICTRVFIVHKVRKTRTLYVHACAFCARVHKKRTRAMQDTDSDWAHLLQWSHIKMDIVRSGPNAAASELSLHVNIQRKYIIPKCVDGCCTIYV